MHLTAQVNAFLQDQVCQQKQKLQECDGDPSHPHWHRIPLAKIWATKSHDTWLVLYLVIFKFTKQNKDIVWAQGSKQHQQMNKKGIISM